MRKEIAFIIGGLFAFLPLSAKVTLPEIIGDNMILQQNSEVNLWGKSTASTVTIQNSWDNTPVTVSVNKDGKWDARIITKAGSYAPQTITFDDGDKTTLNNILIGEVWFASGQSNMEMPLRGFTNCPIKESNEEICFASERKNRIHFVTIPKTPSYTPQDEVKGEWKVCDSDNAPDFSATAYFFAKNLNRAIDVPVGIINCSWGGSRVESWLPKEILKNYKDIDLSKKGIENCTSWTRPLLMYNGMIHPLTKYTIKGFIWYQGESNVSHEKDYADRFATMIKQWRKEWNDDTLPFYFVEIAPYDYGPGISGALLREAQYKSQAIIPFSQMISINDLVLPYEINQIHPCNKQMVGERLCLAALENTYKHTGIESHSPEYKSIKIENNKAILYFNYAKDGFNRLKDAEGFEICGEDHIFYPATITLGKDTGSLVASSDKVSKPVAVRYCFKNFQIGNISNLRSLPLVPFRTDNF